MTDIKDIFKELTPYDHLQSPVDLNLAFEVQCTGAV